MTSELFTKYQFSEIHRGHSGLLKMGKSIPPNPSCSGNYTSPLEVGIYASIVPILGAIQVLRRSGLSTYFRGNLHPTIPLGLVTNMNRTPRNVFSHHLLRCECCWTARLQHRGQSQAGSHRALSWAPSCFWHTSTTCSSRSPTAT